MVTRLVVDVGDVIGDGERPLIWIADDSPLQAAYTQRSLGAGFRYETFADGASVIEQLSAATVLPALLLLDWVMPGLSGDEVCRYLRAAPATRDLPIVILTASRTETGDVVTALDIGANDYVAKPFAPAELRARVDVILRSEHLKREAEREHRRVNAMNDLASALFHAGGDLDRILERMARWLVDSIGDGCAVYLLQDDTVVRHAGHHRTEHGARLLQALPAEIGPGMHTFETPAEARQQMGATLAPYIDAFGLKAVVTQIVPIRGLATGLVVLTRDGTSRAFDVRDASSIETCLEYSALAIEAALRSESERATTRFHEEMLGIVGHDLRTPLSALGLGMELLRGQTQDDKTLGVLGRMERTARRMTSIVEQLLDVTRARIGAGIPVQPRMVLLQATVASVLDELRMARPAAMFEITGDEVEGRWDGDRLQQVVGNLAGNALEYGRPGGMIGFATSVSGPNAYLSVHNENRDAPIARELLETMFAPFQRGRSGSNAQGLGLGLYIVHQIVQAHHGTVTVESDATGTTFRISLPL